MDNDLISIVRVSFDIGRLSEYSIDVIIDFVKIVVICVLWNWNTSYLNSRFSQRFFSNQIRTYLADFVEHLKILV